MGRNVTLSLRWPAWLNAVLLLIASFIGEILSDSPENEGNFDDGAWVQETINAVEASFRQRRWVTLPLA